MKTLVKKKKPIPYQPQLLQPLSPFPVNYGEWEMQVKSQLPLMTDRQLNDMVTKLENHGIPNIDTETGKPIHVHQNLIMCLTEEIENRKIGLPSI